MCICTWYLSERLDEVQKCSYEGGYSWGWYFLPFLKATGPTPNFFSSIFCATRPKPLPTSHMWSGLAVAVSWNLFDLRLAMNYLQPPQTVDFTSEFSFIIYSACCGNVLSHAPPSTPQHSHRPNHMPNGKYTPPTTQYSLFSVHPLMAAITTTHWWPPLLDNSHPQAPANKFNLFVLLHSQCHGGSLTMKTCTCPHQYKENSSVHPCQHLTMKTHVLTFTLLHPPSRVHLLVSTLLCTPWQQ